MGSRKEHGKKKKTKVGRYYTGKEGERKKIEEQRAERKEVCKQEGEKEFVKKEKVGR